MKDARAEAYVNLFAVLGALEPLTRMDPAAQKLLEGVKPVRLGIRVHAGPEAVLAFENGRCAITAGEGECDIRLPFSSCEKFNGMIAGTVTPIPSKGFTRVGFLLKTFKALTDRLSQCLKPSSEALRDAAFFELSTTLMLRVIAAAAVQLGNHDKIAMFSASNIPDGTVALMIRKGPSAAIEAKGHALRLLSETPEHPRAVMEFEDMRLARQVFDGQVNTVACIGDGSIAMRGMISMIDNLNRMLDRVSVYLG